MRTLKNLKIQEGSVCKAGINPRAQITLLKAKKEACMESELRPESLEKADDQVKSYVETLEKSIVRLCEEIEVAKGEKAPEGVDEKVFKALPPEAQAAFVELRKAKQEAEDKAREATEGREIAILEKAVGSEMPHLAATPAEIATMLNAIRKSCPDQYEGLYRVLKAASAATATGIVGQRSSAVAGSSSPLETLNEIAARIQKSEPALTPALAFEKALGTPEGAEAYRRYSDGTTH